MLSIQDYECPICLLILCDPVKLQKCNHNFCLQCLLKLRDFNQELFKCPLCRQEYNQPKFQIDLQLQGTIKKYFANQLLQREKQFKKPVKDNRVKLNIIYGNLHQLIDTESKNKHEWTAFITLQNVDNNNQIPNPNKLIRRVIFTLDETFAEPREAAFKEPFELTKEGWGTFEIPVEIVFHAKYKIPNQYVTIFLDFDHPETKKVQAFYIDDIKQILK